MPLWHRTNLNKMTNLISISKYTQLRNDISKIIEDSKKEAQRLVNQQLINAYWQIGKRISTENLTKNANYQNEVLQKISDDLQIERSLLSRSLLFFNQYPTKLESSKLNWSHYRQLITIKDPILRKKIEEDAIENNLSSRDLTQTIQRNQDQIAYKTKEIIRPIKEDYLYQAKILKVVDGDTLILLIDLGFDVKKEQRVRLTQIDAPELKTPDGQEAFEYLLNIAANLDEIVIKTHKIDMYGRFLGDIFYNPDEENKNFSKSEIFQNGNYLNQELANHPLFKVI